jgi:type IV fimbrial biogenesis protein FimT
MAKLICGFNLLELCGCLLISSILLVAMVPGWQHFMQHQTMASDVNSLVHLLNYAKIAAINYRKNVSLCKSLDHRHCSVNWQGDFLVFIDESSIGKLQNSQQLLYVWTPSKQATIRWQAEQHYLSFNPDGINTGVAGAFYYCPANNELRFARAIVINIVGRIAVRRPKAMPQLSCP